jgi:selenocysteine lyase/cysteine desulfurase
MDKRTFLKSSALLGFGSLATLSSIGKIVDAVAHLPPDAVAKDDDFWASIRNEYSLKQEYINLENGYYCILPKEILERYIAHIRDVNFQGAYYMRTVQFENKKTVAKKLADLAGCTTDELIITRNTTESLDMIIGGQNWKAGDEAIMA